MKILGWILFLLAIAIGLVIYNLKFLPMQDELARSVNENLMWQTQVKELQDKLNQTSPDQTLLFSQVFLWDDLFESISSFELTEPAKLMLKEIISKLQETSNDIIIAGHCDNTPIPPELKKFYPTDRELSFAKAMAVVNFLQNWGIKKERLICIGYGATKPIASNETPDGRSKNRRVEIIVKSISLSPTNIIDTVIKQ